MLFNLWRWLISGCNHTDLVFKQIDVADRGNIVATKMVLRCTKCGRIKVKRV